MSHKERIDLVKSAIVSVKQEANKAVVSHQLLRFSELMLDLGALEQCLEIEVTAALQKLEAEQVFNRAEVIDMFKKAA